MRQRWQWSDRPCGKLLAAALPTRLAAVARHRALRLARPQQAALQAMSPATLDQLLRQARAERAGGRGCRHRLGRARARVGDESGPHPQRGRAPVQRMPARVQHWHTDNAVAFLNAPLLDYGRRHGIPVSRGRGYHKNDQAYVEQRNCLVGRDR